MIDLRDLQKRGQRIPLQKKKQEFTSNSKGFVDFSKSHEGQDGNSQMQNQTGAITETQTGIMHRVGQKSETGSGSSGGFLGFMDGGGDGFGSSSGKVNSGTTPSEDLRKISNQISELDNKLYKLEQRIELLERKVLD